jgi:Transient receptor potential (TRP) ion channel
LQQILIAFPQLVVLCLWELTERDSAAEVVLAICTFVTVLALLFWGSIKVWRIARRSIALHRNPAYGLYSDPKTLHKWGFLYVTFQASMYFFVVPLLCYILIKGALVAFGQSSGTVQAVAFLILETAVLITVSIMKPYMDKKTNALNISIAAVNFFNVILMLFFSNIFNIAVSHPSTLRLLHYASSTKQC